MFSFRQPPSEITISSSILLAGLQIRSSLVLRDTTSQKHSSRAPIFRHSRPLCAGTIFSSHPHFLKSLLYEPAGADLVGLNAQYVVFQNAIGTKTSATLDNICSVGHSAYHLNALQAIYGFLLANGFRRFHLLTSALIDSRECHS